jgi:hypothetical protein
MTPLTHRLEVAKRAWPTGIEPVRRPRASQCGVAAFRVMAAHAHRAFALPFRSTIEPDPHIKRNPHWARPHFDTAGTAVTVRLQKGGPAVTSSGGRPVWRASGRRRGRKGPPTLSCRLFDAGGPARVTWTPRGLTWPPNRMAQRSDLLGFVTTESPERRVTLGLSAFPSRRPRFACHGSPARHRHATLSLEGTLQEQKSTLPRGDLR